MLHRFFISCIFKSFSFWSSSTDSNSSSPANPSVCYPYTIFGLNSATLNSPLYGWYRIKFVRCGILNMALYSLLNINFVWWKMSDSNRSASSQNSSANHYTTSSIWLPRQDLNLRMPESKSGALPLGDWAILS